MADQQTPEQHPLAWDYLAHSEVGLVRKNNQDSGLVSARLLMVADGMGGAAAGDLASAVAVDTMAAIDRGLDDTDNTLEHPEDVAEELRRADLENDQSSEHADHSPDEGEQAPEPVEGHETEHLPAHAAPDDSPSTSTTNEEGTAPAGGDRLQQLAAGISAANTRIADLVSTDYSLEGMGTTVTAAVLDGDRIGLAHIGDSRGYLFRDSELEQLTHDHSWVQSLIDDGKISEEEAAAHPHRSLLLKVLNGQPANEPDLSTVPLQVGDRLLLCSDGLCGFVEDVDIADALDGTSREEAMRLLVDAAHAAGGLDNITIIIADLIDADSTADRAAVTERDQHDDDQRPEPGSVHQVSGPGAATQVLGAAAEHDIAADEEEIRQRAADRDADDADDDEDEEYDEYLVEPGDDSDDEARYAPQPPAKGRWRRPLLLTLVVLLIIGAAAAAGFAWTRTQYYVGADKSQVAIFQGLNESVPGIPLSRVYEVQQLRLADLPAYYQGMVRETIDTDGLDSARATVEQLRATAARCAESQPSTDPADPSGSPTASPKTSPTSTSKSTASAKPTGKQTSKPPAKTTSPKSPSTKSPSTKSPSTKPTSTGATTSASPTAGPTTNGQLPGGEKC
ncbi:PP2C family protein-serine/threonine phosphatase [Microlunatus soli]|uniref:Protein phosphatase n=1 Tax=Microlunatus soli TaxID=630515 RepID=A0A1H1TMW1_9ACTN|nr:protein phosphatase 2C domain-containing protein [Microlunatus soli]SDS61474.1 protein phosphatase [Microlunatus soli]